MNTDQSQFIYFFVITTITRGEEIPTILHTSTRDTGGRPTEGTVRETCDERMAV